MKNIITKTKLKKYFNITKKALEIAKKNINKKYKREASIIIDMAERYFIDARYFKEKGNYVNAFAALNYSHGWLDTGSVLGIFKTKNDKLFILSDKSK